MTEKRTTATWSLELNCDCPKCGEYVDLMDSASDHLTDSVFDICEHGTERTKNVDVYCPECGADFAVDLEY
jgi:endogenous inhibitor of DNA gyrase (YacG/DUF329 family)